MITDTQLLNIFKGSPLSRRAIRSRLGFPARSVLSAVLFSAVKRGVLKTVEPIEVGCHKYKMYLYKP